VLLRPFSGVVILILRNVEAWVAAIEVKVRRLWRDDIPFPHAGSGGRDEEGLELGIALLLTDGNIAYDLSGSGKRSRPGGPVSSETTLSAIKAFSRRAEVCRSSGSQMLEHT
jgi:hypothetical protein